MADWLEIVVPSPLAIADAVAEHLVRELSFASGGVQERSGELVFWVSTSEGERALAETTAVVRALADRGFDIDPDEVRVGDSAPEQEWRDAWKEHFHATRLTRQLVVVPSWENWRPEDGDIELRLDPGQAFGTGLHASTQLCLSLLQTLADDGLRVSRVLDVGTGSGILAIFALKLWPAARALGVDTDPLAVSAATDNARENDCAQRMEVSQEGLDALDGPFDVVLANIQAPVLRDMRDALAELCAPGGHLLLSGILTSQAPAVAEYFSALGDLSTCALQKSELDPEWTSVHLMRTPAQ